MYFIDSNRVQNQEHEYTHRRSVWSICWNLWTAFININKFGAFSAILDKDRRSLGQNGENVLISDFQMLASMQFISISVTQRK